jgi:hypothetical protein
VGRCREEERWRGRGPSPDLAKFHIRKTGYVFVDLERFNKSNDT